MRDELLWYYERELGYLRRLGAEYAQRYPKVAGRLQLEATKCEDPHVERLLEGFAFLAARIHLKLDDDVSQVAESLLAIVAPQLVRPVPALSIAEFVADPERAAMPEGVRVPRGSLLRTRAVGGMRCTFRTAANVHLWPITVADARWVTPDALQPPVRATDAVGALRIELRAFPGVALSSLELDSLRVHLHGDGAVASTLHEVLCRDTTAILVRALDPDKPAGGNERRIEVSSRALTPGGFGADERLLEGGAPALAPYGLLQEYMALPAAFRSVDLAIGNALRACNAQGAAEIVILVGAFERGDRRAMLAAGVTRDTVRLGCTPVVNLYEHVAEPILLTHRRDEYQLIPDAQHRLAIEVYAVTDVVGVPSGGGEPTRYEPLYGLKHEVTTGAPPVFWVARRHPAPERGARSSDLSLAFVDRGGRTFQPRHDVVTARTLCFNGDLPSRLPVGDPRGDFELVGGGPLTRIVALLRPTASVHPRLGSALAWRMVSQLSLNHLSLDGGPDALRELLRLHDHAESPDIERQIQGILDVRSEAVHARIPGLSQGGGLALARGRRITLDIDEDHFAGDGAWIFASVLDRFFSLYASLNSFTQLTVATRQRRRPLGEWAPRSGSRALG
ncbi:MAG: type VI secretion system baseplate subunit TssF [Gemmatimonadota bacterium]